MSQKAISVVVSTVPDRVQEKRRLNLESEDLGWKPNSAAS